MAGEPAREQGHEAVVKAPGHRRQHRIPADLLDGQAGQLDRAAGRGACGPAPASSGRDEDDELVDEAGLEERGGERRAALEQQRLDAVGGERRELLGERARAQLEAGAFGERPAAEGEPAGLAGGVDAAGVEPRRVGADRAHPDGDGVGARAQLVDGAAALPRP